MKSREWYITDCSGNQYGRLKFQQLFFFFRGFKIFRNWCAQNEHARRSSEIASKNRIIPKKFMQCVYYVVVYRTLVKVFRRSCFIANCYIWFPHNFSYMVFKNSTARQSVYVIIIVLHDLKHTRSVSTILYWNYEIAGKVFSIPLTISTVRFFFNNSK